MCGPQSHVGSSCLHSSHVSLRRSEYSTTVKREGFEVLIAAIEKKLADFAEGRVDDDPTRVSSGPAAKP